MSRPTKAPLDPTASVRSYRRTAADIAVVRALLKRKAALDEIGKSIGLSAESVSKYFQKEIAELRPEYGPASSFAPTDEQRRMVQLMAANSFKNADIARAVGPDGITVATLEKWFAHELTAGATRMHFEIANAMWMIGQYWRVHKKEPNRVHLDALKHLAAIHMGWTPKSAVELTVNKPLDQYTDDELAAELARLSVGSGAEEEEGA